MKNNNRKIVFVVGTILVMVLLVWLFSSGGGDDTKRKRQAYVSSNWSKKYQLQDKNPLGLYLFDEFMDAYLDTSNSIYVIDEWAAVDTSREFIRKPKTFVFVGNLFGLHSFEMDSLMDHVKEGSTLFMSYNDLTENLYEYLYYDFDMQFDYAEDVNVFCDAGKFNMVNVFQNDTIATEWQGFNEVDAINDHNTLSSFMELENFIEFPYGKGRVLLHTNPNMFYNYELKRKDGFGYCSFVLSQLKQDQDVYYLELGRLSDNFGDYDVDDMAGAEGKKDDSYLRLILGNPYLLTALLLTILGAMLFVIFRSKRTRPVVPYISDKKDMTMAFTETITSIYYGKRNPYGILSVMRRNFFSAVQRYFFIDLSKRNGDKEIISLAEKTNTNVKDLKSLIAQMETTEAFQVTDQYIAEVQKKQHEFYRKTGIISDKLSAAVKERAIVFKRSLWLPLLMIFAGMVLVVLGLYYLSTAIGIGIILWPLGVILTILGAIRLSKPYLIVEGEMITYFSPIGSKKEFKKDDLQKVDLMKGGAVLRFNEDKHLTINYWDMSQFDKKQFELFILKIEK